MKPVHVHQNDENQENFTKKIEFSNFQIEFFDNFCGKNEENENSYFTKIPGDSEFLFHSKAGPCLPPINILPPLLIPANILPHHNPPPGTNQFPQKNRKKSKN